MDHPALEQPQTGPRDPVDRARRSRFIFAVVGYCLIVATGLVFLAAFGLISAQIALVSSFVNGLLGLAGVGAVAYVGGSSLDYNGGMGNIFRRGGSDPYGSSYRYSGGGGMGLGYQSAGYQRGAHFTPPVSSGEAKG